MPLPRLPNKHQLFRHTGSRRELLVVCLVHMLLSERQHTICSPISWADKTLCFFGVSVLPSLPSRSKCLNLLDHRPLTGLSCMQTARQAAKVTEKEARDTEEEYKAGNAAMSTYKASQAAWKASQAAEAANEAEQFALEASQHARNARTAAALDNALAAAQAYNQASRSPPPPFMRMLEIARVVGVIVQLQIRMPMSIS